MEVWQRGHNEVTRSKKTGALQRPAGQYGGSRKQEVTQPGCHRQTLFAALLEV